MNVAEGENLSKRVTSKKTVGKYIPVTIDTGVQLRSIQEQSGLLQAQLQRAHDANTHRP